ncbi:class I SAM-dependent methyltransferase [Qipengyuania sp. CAU 1752]
MTIEQYHSHVRRDIFPFVSKGGNLLDIGGGDGATARAIRQEGLADTVGVADMVAPRNDDLLDFTWQGDLTSEGAIESIGAEHGPFDTILACDILEHFADPWSIVSRLHRQLKQGGTLVASIPNVRHWSVSGALFLKGRFAYTQSGILDRTHLRFFVRDTAQALMGSSGLRVERVAPLPSGRRLDRVITRIPVEGIRSLGALQYAIVARRVD